MAKIHQESEADPMVIKSKVVAILGYGNQGRAQALNLRDNGCNIVVGARKGGDGWHKAKEDGFAPYPIGECASDADVLMMTLPDEAMPEIYAEEIAIHVDHTKTLMVCHGFAFHFGFILPPPGVDVCLAAPKGSGASLRAAFESKRSLAGLFAVLQNASGQGRQIAMSYLWGIGCAGSLMIETTFEEECVTDLFGEQVVLCGGIPELIKAAFETLVAAGYSPESAYLECLHEAKLITDLMYERGLSGMRQAISDTAEWGGYQVGKRVIGPSAKQEMARVLTEVQDGSFAKKWIAEHNMAKHKLLRERHEESLHPMEEVGKRLRESLLKD